MGNPDKESTLSRVIAAEARAAKLLLVPYESAGDRQAALDEAAKLVLQAAELLVRGGCDQLARAANELARNIDSAKV